jgi:hypothetical protein
MGVGVPLYTRIPSVEDADVVPGRMLEIRPTFTGSLLRCLAASRSLVLSPVKGFAHRETCLSKPGRRHSSTVVGPRHFNVAGAAGRLSSASPGLCTVPGSSESRFSMVFVLVRPRSLSKLLRTSSGDVGPMPPRNFEESEGKPAASGNRSGGAPMGRSGGRKSPALPPVRSNCARAGAAARMRLSAQEALSHRIVPPWSSPRASAGPCSLLKQNPAPPGHRRAARPLRPPPSTV